MKPCACLALLALAATAAAVTPPPAGGRGVTLLRAGAKAQLAAQADLGQHGEAAKRREPSSDVMRVSKWKAMLSGSAGLIGGIVIGGLIFTVLMRSSSSGDAPAQEKEPLVQAEAAGAAASSSSAAEAPAAAAKGPEPEAAMDFGKIITELAQKVSDKVGPKFAEGAEARVRLEERAVGMKDKLMNFALTELNDTAGQLMKAVEAEEAALLLDWNAAVAANFPSPAVLLAGSFSPAILAVRKVCHLLQLFAGLVPIMILCVWAIIADWHTTCVIPSIYAWCYVQGGLALLLCAGHFMMYSRIAAGKKVLDDKAAAMNERLKGKSASDDEVSVGEMREIFICGSVLVQQALLVEDSVRRSVWHTVNGVGSLIWIITGIWNFVIVVGWTFYPGDIAFHPKAATVAADDYCGALVTVLVARIVFLLHLVFFGANLLQLVGWIIDSVMSSPALGESLMATAKSADAGMLGIPVVQTLVKAFVLRGGEDLTGSQLAVVLHARAQLERDLSKAEQQVGALDGKLKLCKAEEDALKAKTAAHKGSELQASIDQMETFGEDDMSDWKAKGVAAIEQLQQQAQSSQEASTKDLEVVMQKVTDFVEMIQGSEAYKSAMAQAQEAAEAAQQQASMVAGQLNAENFQAVMAQAQQAAEAGMAQVDTEGLRNAVAQAQQAATDAAGQLSAENLQDVMAQAQQAAEAGMASASEQAAQLHSQAAQLHAQAQDAAQAGMASASERAAQLSAQAQDAAQAGMASASEQATQLHAQAQEAAQAGMASASEQAAQLHAQGQEAAQAGMASASEQAAQLHGQAQQAAEAGMASATEKAGQFHAQAKQAAEAGMASATEKAGQLSAQAQQAAEAGVASASEAAGQLSAQAQQAQQAAEAGLASASDQAGKLSAQAQQAAEAGAAKASEAAQELRK